MQIVPASQDGLSHSAQTRGGQSPLPGGQSPQQLGPDVPVAAGPAKVSPNISPAGSMSRNAAPTSPTMQNRSSGVAGIVEVDEQGQSYENVEVPSKPPRPPIPPAMASPKSPPNPTSPKSNPNPTAPGSSGVSTRESSGLEYARLSRVDVSANIGGDDVSSQLSRVDVSAHIAPSLDAAVEYQVMGQVTAHEGATGMSATALYDYESRTLDEQVLDNRNNS